MQSQRGERVYGEIGGDTKTWGEHDVHARLLRAEQDKRTFLGADEVRVEAPRTNIRSRPRMVGAPVDRGFDRSRSARGARVGQITLDLRQGQIVVFPAEQHEHGGAGISTGLGDRTKSAPWIERDVRGKPVRSGIERRSHGLERCEMRDFTAVRKTRYGNAVGVDPWLARKKAQRGECVGNAR